MKLFKQLSLVAAVAYAGNAFALEAMTEAALSGTTGQDGITISIASPSGLVADYIYVHDKDGLTPTGFGITTATAGAITLGTKGDANDSFKMVPKDTSTWKMADIIIDADGNGGNGGVLNINIKTSDQGMSISTGSIGVAQSNRTTAITSPDSFAVSGIAGTSTKILDSITIDLTGSATTNIQLGAQPQGSMIKMNGVVNGGIAINNLNLYDNNGSPSVACAASTCGLGIGRLTLADDLTAASRVLTLDSNVDIDSRGLVIKSNRASALGIEQLKLGTIATAKAIGDIEIGAMGAGTEIIISGH